MFSNRLKYARVSSAFGALAYLWHTMPSARADRLTYVLGVPAFQHGAE